MIPKICAVGLLVALVGALLSECGWRGKKMFGVLCATVLLAGLGESVSLLFGGVTVLSESAGISEVASAALKVVGAGYVFGFSADVARELGESSVASALTLAGRVEILLLVFPYFQKIISLGVELIK